MSIDSISISSHAPDINSSKNITQFNNKSDNQAKVAEPVEDAEENQQTNETEKNVTQNNEEKLTRAEYSEITKLRNIDRKVKAHEMAHVAAGGQYVRRGARFRFIKGPDGKNYAIAGDVSIDTSSIPGDPKATVRKMNAVRRAALAPLEPSPQDQAVASMAARVSSKAMMELALLRSKEIMSGSKNIIFDSSNGNNENQNSNKSIEAYQPNEQNGTNNGTNIDHLI